MNGDEPARDWLAPDSGIHSVFVNEESNPMAMSVISANEVEFVAFWGRSFSEVFSAYLTEPKDISSVSLHFMIKFFSFSCCSQ